MAGLVGVARASLAALARVAVLLYLQPMREPAERAGRSPALVGLELPVVVAIEALEQELLELTPLADWIGVGSATEPQHGQDGEGDELHVRMTRRATKR